MALLAALLAMALFQTLPLLGSQLDPPRQYYYQPENRIYLKLLDAQERDITEIIRQRMQKVWGADATPYLSALTQEPYRGYYQSDSVLSQRRSIWRSSLFAKDLDFIEVAISTFDGRYSLRETYAINRDDKRWVVIDSAGFPLFERILDITEDNIDTEQGRRDFLLTLLSYAGYGSFDILSSPDTMYHEIDLDEKIGEDYYPFKSVTKGDTTETTFTCCLRDGVEVSRWRIKYFGDGLLIDESEQLVTYEDLPSNEDTTTTTTTDTSALAGLLTDVPADSTSDSAKSRPTAPPRPQAPGGDIRLADLLRMQTQPQLASGNVSYEIVSAKLVNPADSTPIDQMPEFSKFVEPIYPPKALAEQAEGTVEIMLRVDSTGKARQTMIRKRSDKNKLGFEISAKKAGEQSEFRPGFAAGRPADMWFTYRLKFRLTGASAPTKTATTPGAVSDSTVPDTSIPKTDTIPKPDSLSDSVSSPDSTVSDSADPESTAPDSTVSDSTKKNTPQPDSSTVPDSLDSSKDTSATSDTTKGNK